MALNKTSTKLMSGGVMGAAATAAYLLFFRPWHLRWGATTAETIRPLPGDELVSNPKQISTRAITIETPVDEVWSWLVQIGQGRGGFYSYDFLENLIGCDIHSTDQILPEYQQLAVGDRVRLGPEGYPFYTVAGLETGWVLTLWADAPEGEEAPIEETWLFYLNEIGPDRTRLIVRNRRAYEPTVGNVLMWRVLVEPIHFIMEQKMMRGIKNRAEAAQRNGR